MPLPWNLKKNKTIFFNFHSFSNARTRGSSSSIGTFSQSLRGQSVVVVASLTPLISSLWQSRLLTLDKEADYKKPHVHWDKKREMEWQYICLCIGWCSESDCSLYIVSVSDCYLEWREQTTLLRILFLFTIAQVLMDWLERQKGMNISKSNYDAAVMSKSCLCREFHVL